MSDRRRGCGCGNLVSLLGLIIAVVGLVIAVTVPEIRCALNLECPENPPSSSNSDRIPMLSESAPHIVVDTDYSNRSYIVYFCEDLQFRNGGYVTTADAISFLERGLNANYVEYSSIESVDDYTIQIRGANSEYAVTDMLKNTFLDSLEPATLCR